MNEETKVQLRLYLLSRGFVQDGMEGKIYKLKQKVNNYTVIYTADVDGIIKATFPDLVYNRKNPYSPKDCTLDMEFKQDNFETIKLRFTDFETLVASKL